MINFRLLIIFCGLILSLPKHSFASDNNVKNKLFNTSPIFSDINDNIRNKSLFFGGIGFALSVNGASHSHTSSIDATHTLNWGSMFNAGFVANLGLNITNRLWTELYTENTWGFAGNASLMNIVSAEIGSIIASQYNNAKVDRYEVKTIIGYDFLRFSKSDISVYGGFMYNRFHYNTSSGTVISSAGDFVQEFGSITHTFNLLSAVIGMQEKFYDTSITYTAFQEFYIGGLVDTSFNNSSIAPSYDKYWRNSDLPTFGFGLGGSAEFDIGHGLCLKPFVKYQMFFMPNLLEKGDNGSGFFNIWSASTGLAISWK